MNQNVLSSPLPVMPNLPSDVQEKVERLYEYRRQISGLELKLRKIWMDHDRLQRELLKYRIVSVSEEAGRKRKTIPHRVVTPAIDKLPNEMLVHIFKYFLSANHWHIRRIASVCRHWYQVVTQNPRLWTRIQISPMNYTEYRRSKLSLANYVNACLQYSQSLLLDIELDYREFSTRDIYIAKEIQQRVRQITDPSEEDDIQHWTLELDCDFASKEYDAYFLEVFDNLASLVGPAGAHMERWQKVEISFPRVSRDPYLARGIWKKLIGSTPNLRWMKLNQVDAVLGADAWDNEFESGFPNVAGLSSLTIDCPPVSFWLKGLTICPSQLRSLDIQYDGSLDGLFELSSFTHLHELILRAFVNPDEDAWNDAQFTIRLPHLHTLSLRGNSQMLKCVGFDLPNLENLLIRTFDGFYLPPTVEPKWIGWRISPLYQTYWTQERITAALLILLQPRKRLENIVIPGCVDDVVPEVRLVMSMSHLSPSQHKSGSGAE